MNVETKKPQSRVKKEQTVEVLKNKLAKAKSVVLTDNSGLTVTQVDELKKKLRAVDAEMIVAKNTLLKIAAKSIGHEVPEEVLEGPTAALFAYSDEFSPLKELEAFTKTNEKPVVKAGFLGSTFISAERVISLAKLPSKEVLRGQVVGSLYSPLYGIVGVLNANLRNLVFALDQVIKGKKANV